MNDVQKLAAEVATFYHALMEAGISDFVATQLCGTFLSARLQFGRYPAESPIIPVQESGEYNNAE